jgi:general stress protein CsbA
VVPEPLLLLWNEIDTRSSVDVVLTDLLIVAWEDIDYFANTYITILYGVIHNTSERVDMWLE